jgi:hypothetical protein
MKLDVNTVLDLVQEIQITDPIDYSNLSVDPDSAARLIVLSVIEQFETQWSGLTGIDRDYAMAATVSKLVLENFILNLQLKAHEI